MEGIGSLVKLEKSLAKYPGGEIDIAVRGIDLITLESFYAEHSQRLYPHGKIKRLNKNNLAATESLFKAFDKYNEKVLKLDLDKYPKMNFFLIANSIGLNDLEKYDLLIREDNKAINKTLTNYLKLKTIIASQHNALHENYCLN
jgi:hypothetical protein